ncbi:hypothetical protein RIEGSTA812A_PEG_539 [invertebrate metagenome]|uniref:Uncharacterized protein n=1 Tax=invertebrate metagenome TaxID=1711999 RepID=A0A484H550_9ZZZZ
MAPRLFVLILFCSLSGRPAAGSGETPQDFVTRDLLTHLTNDRAFDWNRIASLSFPLTMRVLRQEEEADTRPLTTVARLLSVIKPASLSCGDATNAALTAGFLSDAGVTFASSTAAPSATNAIPMRLAHCREDLSPFETVNTLLFLCRYSPKIVGHAPDPREVRAAFATILALQQADGRFTFPGLTFLGTYYLSSHALIALYACGMSGLVVKHAQDYLWRTLYLFRYAGFLDGLAESLIFLAWTATTIVPTWATHVAFLRTRVRSDGGICFIDRSDCRSHWHTTALMAELESLDSFLHQHGVLPSGPFTPRNTMQ